jgi:hypothetical protein
MHSKTYSTLLHATASASQKTKNTAHLCVSVQDLVAAPGQHAAHNLTLCEAWRLAGHHLAHTAACQRLSWLKA